jgi:Ca2+-transporting ATPase
VRRWDAAVIGVINGVLGFVQEVGGERALLALRDTLERRAGVVRDGNECEVPVEQVVPGDLLVVRKGERVAADGRIVLAEGLTVDESLLTGGSVPADKAVRPVAAGAPLAECASMVFGGTGVTRGRGRALVTATGIDVSAQSLGAVAIALAAADGRYWGVAAWDPGLAAHTGLHAPEVMKQLRGDAGAALADAHRSFAVLTPVLI